MIKGMFPLYLTNLRDTHCFYSRGCVHVVLGTKEIDMAATLEHLRDQRPDMVKTKVRRIFLCA